MECGYGWPNAEYNLMSWALSCCSLRAHYDQVELYTDQRGYDVLIQKLCLPYTDVHVVYDDNLCLPQHWSTAKIKTYAMQTRPFLHVDGDVYVPTPLRQESLDAPLIAQNREIGTAYYRNMVDNVLRHKEIVFPQHISEALLKEPVTSYNMGLFGGYDLEFIHRYCETSLSFLEDNHMNDSTYPHSKVCCNILFEQVFFAVLAEFERRKVAGILDHPVKDQGYSGREFADLAYWEQRPFFHLLGGHKRNAYNTDMIRRTLLRLYPDILERIIPLCSANHQRYATDMEDKAKGLSIERSIASYEDTVEHYQDKWKSLKREDLYAWERRSAEASILMWKDREVRQDFWMGCNPYLKLFHLPDEYHPEAIRLLHGRLNIEAQYPLTDVMMLPCLYEKGMREVPMVDMQVKALNLLQTGPMKYGDLEALLQQDYVRTNEKSIKSWQKIFSHQLAELIYKGILVLYSE